MPFDGTQLNETAAHLLRAKQYIEERGWCPTGQGRPGAPVCISHAIFLTRQSDLLFAADTFMNALGLPYIGVWNDTPGRTLDEVYAAFDRAIALAMGDGV